MRHFMIITAIVASTAMAGSATAQVQGPTEQPEAPQEQTPQGQASSEAPAALPETPDARAEHLDELFNRLADPDNANWERTVAQIHAAWNNSGSPSMDLIASRADQAMERKDYETALLHLNDLTRLAPEFAEGWNKRATIYFIQGEYGASLDDIARTLRLEPRHFSALSGLGIILDRVGDKKGALEAYRRAVRIHPNLQGVEDGIRKLTKEVEGQRL